TAAGPPGPRLDGGARLPRGPERAPRGGGADHPGAGGPRGPRRRPGGPARGRRAPRVRDAVAPVSARRADELAEAAGSLEVGARGAGLGDRGRLRQRVPSWPPPDPVSARPRRGRPRDLRRQLQQDALPGASPRLPRRAVGPPGTGPPPPRRRPPAAPARGPAR